MKTTNIFSQIQSLGRNGSLGILVVGALLAVSACGPSAPTAQQNSCTGTETRCSGDTYQVCKNGEFTTAQTCAGQCVQGFGCGDCEPGTPLTCRDNSVYECKDDGTVGDLINQCLDGQQCAGGKCTNECTADGADLVYVVDTSNKFLSFDPRKIGSGQNPFTSIGTLNCSGSGTPFSMSVDREGNAWVLYQNSFGGFGGIYKVSTLDASCTPVSFTPSGPFQLFGMGFVTDDAGGDVERLWVASGGGAGCCGNLGYLSGTSITDVGPVGITASRSAELTGTGSAELFAFFPNASGAFVQQVDKTTAEGVGPKYNAGNMGTVSAWAFAAWGGKFYLFVSVGDEFGISVENNVIEVDPETNTFANVITDHQYTVVGAGVSTCAPVVVD